MGSLKQLYNVQAYQHAEINEAQITQGINKFMPHNSHVKYHDLNKQ